MFCFTGSLDGVLTDALVHKKVKFVELILQQGVVMKEYLTVEVLEKLYKDVSTDSSSRFSMSSYYCIFSIKHPRGLIFLRGLY